MKANRERAKQSLNHQAELLREISGKLDRLIGVSAIQGKELNEQIQILTRLGLDASIIGSILGLSSNAVRIRRSRKGRA